MAGQPDLCPCCDPAAAVVDSAIAGQGPQLRPVLPRTPHCRIFPAAWRRTGRLRRELDRRALVGIQRQHRRGRPQAHRCGRDHRGHRIAAVGARQARRPDQHRRFLYPLAADLAPRSNPAVQPFRLGRLRRHRRDRLDPVVHLERRHARRLATPDRQPRDLCRHRHCDRGDGARPRRIAGGRYPSRALSHRCRSASPWRLAGVRRSH